VKGVSTVTDSVDGRGWSSERLFIPTTLAAAFASSGAGCLPHIEYSLAEIFTLKVEIVRMAFQEEHPEDKFVEFRSIHLATQNVGGLKKEAFELGKGDLFAVHIRGILMIILTFRLFFRFSSYSSEAAIVDRYYNVRTG
jgi:hypothetical protein